MCLLRWLIRSPQQFTQTSRAFFRLPPLRLILGPQQRKDLQTIHRQASTPCPPAQCPCAPTHTPLLSSGRGILTTQSQSPGSPWAWGFQEGPQSNTPRHLPMALGGLLPGSVYTAQSSLSCAHSQTSGRPDSKLVVSPFHLALSSMPNNRASVMPSPPNWHVSAPLARNVMLSGFSSKPVWLRPPCSLNTILLYLLCWHWRLWWELSAH